MIRRTPVNLAPAAPAALAASLLLVVLTGVGGCGMMRERAAMKRADQLHADAIAAERQGDRARAIEALEAATAEVPEHVPSRAMLGDLYRSQGDHAQAAEQYEVLTAVQPDVATHHYNLGVAYQLLDRLRLAAASYLSALELNPDDVQASTNLALVYLALGEPERAEELARRAVQIDPSLPDAHTNLGVVLDARGDLPGAESAYRKAIDLDVQQPTVLINLTGNLLRQSKVLDAVSVMEQAIAVADTAQTRKRYGDALAQAGRYPEAIQQYLAALDHDPRLYTALNQIGWTYATMYRDGLRLNDRQRRAAIVAWQRSLEINPDQPRIAQAIEDWSSEPLLAR